MKSFNIDVLLDLVDKRLIHRMPMTSFVVIYKSANIVINGSASNVDLYVVDELAI